jgi:hypothetical protein
MSKNHSAEFIRMSIDIPLKDLKRIKALASKEGVAVEDFMIECIHPKINPEKKLNAKTRKAIDEARKHKTIKARAISDIYKQLRT